MGERRTTLDPLLGPALQLESLPVIPERYASVAEATKLTEVMERLGTMATEERDSKSAAQLMNTAEALAVCVVNLIAYSRGRVPKVSSRAPDTNILL